MKMFRRSRGWVLGLALAAAGLGILPAASSAAPRRAQCATINENVADELGWVNYFTALSSACYRAGNIDGAVSASNIAGTYQSLADGACGSLHNSDADVFVAAPHAPRM